MRQAAVFRMIQLRVEDAKVRARNVCHRFRATRFAEHLKNSGKLEIAQRMATR